MRVRIYRGERQPAYRIAIPYPRELAELSAKVQEAGRKLGGLVFEQDRELRANDPFEQSWMAQISVEGAAIWKIEVQFNEIED
jgi:hypothetical protein